MHPLYSVGHSNHSLEFFLDLLRAAHIEVLVDVRSHPYSRYVPQFNLEALRQSLASAGLGYLFRGKELGGRPEEDDFYDEEGYVLYDKVARAARFQSGLERLEKGREQLRLALMCSEENPAVCHRHLLIGRVLAERGVPYFHLRAEGQLQSDLEVRRTQGKYTEVYQPTLFGDVEDKPWRSLRPLAAKDRAAERDAMEE